MSCPWEHALLRVESSFLALVGSRFLRHSPYVIKKKKYVQGSRKGVWVFNIAMAGVVHADGNLQRMLRTQRQNTAEKKEEVKKKKKRDRQTAGNR